jgi:hypothetical protein
MSPAVQIDPSTIVSLIMRREEKEVIIQDLTDKFNSNTYFYILMLTA